MITISYTMTNGVDVTLEDFIESLMMDADYDRVQGGMRGNQRYLEFKGDSIADEQDFPSLVLIHGELLDGNDTITWSVDNLES